MRTLRATSHQARAKTVRRRQRGAAQRSRRLWQTLVPTAGALVCAAGIAAAAIPDSSGTIHGCFSARATAAGAGSPLLLNDPARGSCATGLSPLTFNQTGPPGRTGAQGVAGPTGPAGPGARLYSVDLTPIDRTSSDDGSRTRLGAAGLADLYVRCSHNSGVVYAEPLLSGPAGRFDATIVLAPSTALPVSSITSGEFADTTSMELGLAGARDGEPDAASWIGGVFSSGRRTVLLQLWAHAVAAADGHPGSCHVAAIVTPVEG